MITFKKTPDPKNEFDVAEVVYTTKSSTLIDLLEDYKNFLLACGYPINWNDELVLKSYYEELETLEEEE